MLDAARVDCCSFLVFNFNEFLSLKIKIKTKRDKGNPNINLCFLVDDVFDDPCYFSWLSELSVH